jgi:hypothetical protein
LLTPSTFAYIFPALIFREPHILNLKGKRMSTIATLVALLIALSSATSQTSKGINPVQHSERAPVQTGKGINPVQHSE